MSLTFYLNNPVAGVSLPGHQILGRFCCVPLVDVHAAAWRIVHGVPSYFGQTGFAILINKGLFLTMSFGSTGAIEMSNFASPRAALQKQGTRPEVHLY